MPGQAAMTVSVNEVSNESSKETGVVSPRIAHPLTGRFVANEQVGSMPVEVRTRCVGDGRVLTQSESIGKQIDFLFLPGEEGPARSAWNLWAYSFKTAGVSWSGSMLIE